MTGVESRRFSLNLLGIVVNSCYDYERFPDDEEYPQGRQRSVHRSVADLFLSAVFLEQARRSAYSRAFRGGRVSRPLGQHDFFSDTVRDSCACLCFFHGLPAFPGNYEPSGDVFFSCSGNIGLAVALGKASSMPAWIYWALAAALVLSITVSAVRIVLANSRKSGAE